MLIQTCQCCGEIFECAEDWEIWCWVCTLQDEIDYAEDHGYLESNYYYNQERVGSENTDTYWGEWVFQEDDIPF